MTESRWGGIAGLAFLGGVLLQNGVLLQGNPLPGVPLDEVAAWYADRAGSIALACGWVAINVPLLLLFGSAVSERIAKGGQPVWARMGFGGVVLLAAAFSCTTWLQAVLAARAADLAASGQLAVVWDFHTAAFAMSGVALATTLLGFSAGSWTTGVVPRWTAAVGFLGVGLLGGAGAAIVSTVDGGPGIFLQLGGFVTWVVWLLTASIGLLRSQSVTSAVVAAR
jgi:hypothetical protein